MSTPEGEVVIDMDAQSTDEDDRVDVPVPVTDIKEFEDKDLRQCNICLEDEYEDYLSLTSCKHEFHHHCLVLWLKSGGTTCPLCRKHFYTVRIGRPSILKYSDMLSALNDMSYEAKNIFALLYLNHALVGRDEVKIARTQLTLPQKIYEDNPITQRLLYVFGFVNFARLVLSVATIVIVSILLDGNVDISYGIVCIVICAVLIGESVSMAFIHISLLLNNVLYGKS